MAPAIGLISLGKVLSPTADRSPAPRLDSAVLNRRTGRRLRWTIQNTPNKPSGIITISGNPSPTKISRATSARWLSGSATAMVIVPCNAAS